MSSSSSPDVLRTDPSPSAALLTSGARLASGTALVFLLLVLGQTISRTLLLGKPGWAETLLVITTALATLTSLARQLSGIKVLLAAAIIGLAGGIAHGVGVKTAIPFGPFVYTDSIGPKIFDTVAWAMPGLWIIIALNARGVARLIMKPWRKLKSYGFWVIGVATVLVVLMNLALEPFATRHAHYWVWLPTKFPFTWHGMPWINSLGWALTTLLMLAFATPFLVNKNSRSRKLPPDYHPLIVWLLLLTLFSASAAMNQLWSATALCAGTAMVSAIFAVRGARW